MGHLFVAVKCEFPPGDFPHFEVGGGFHVSFSLDFTAKDS